MAAPNRALGPVGADSVQALPFHSQVPTRLTAVPPVGLVQASP
jgi:hypothetical protein